MKDLTDQLICCAPVASPSLSDEDAAGAATLFKAMGDPHRVKLVNILLNAGAPVCVCDLTAPLGLSQPTVSFHLKKLMSAGLIDREQRGTWAYYSMRPKALQNLSAMLKQRRETR
jgi:ArsR family transcriptional regulator